MVIPSVLQMFEKKENSSHIEHDVNGYKSSKRFNSETFEGETRQRRDATIKR